MENQEAQSESSQEENGDTGGTKSMREEVERVCMKWTPGAHKPPPEEVGQG